MDEYVTVVVRYDPTADGPFVKKVFRHYSDAELWVSRQNSPKEYLLSNQRVELNG